MECRVMKPRWAEIEKDRPELKTEFYEYDDHPEIIARYQPTEMPCFVFVDKNDQEIRRFYGDVKKEILIQAIKEDKDK